MAGKQAVFVRPATPADLHVLVTLNAIVQALHVRLEPDEFKAEVDAAELRAFFASLLDKPENDLLIAEQSAEPVGYLWYELQERPPTVLTQARRRIYIQDIAVREPARRAGVATALLRAVEAAATALQVDRLVLDAWTRNEEALRFFQGRGFRPFNVVLAKALR
ncbi:GNAT family N-acetyltransferase [Methylobacterium sp. J-026]|uniref:GNAT family N-acetyltransferase n=1 Tax=Methylobacterium sp. J-026 TaxID=2836624 RepID=UPI001FBA1904|nr:GNAT family N-acetyltransferase [Methylobacterium sp. J-026]MCJ2134502.1 GNAT family N-acetyltransferase [Methylobacterium sp. J-026]